MAESTVFLNVISTGQVSAEFPNQNIRPKSAGDGSYGYYNIRLLSSDDDERVYFKVENLPDNIKHKRLYSVSVEISAYVPYTKFGRLALYAPKRNFDTASVTYITRPAGEYIDYAITVFGSSGPETITLPNYTGKDDVYKSAKAKDLLRYGGFYIYPPRAAESDIEVYDERYPNPCRYVVLYDDEITVTSTVRASGKTSGYVNPHTAETFSWVFEPSGAYACASDWSQATATFFWREGTDGNWTAVEASGSIQAVTIPAETMPVGTVQWYVQATDDQGTTSSSPVYTITTEDSLQVATPLSPIGTVEDGSAEILMTWQEANDTGTTPTGVDLQISTNGTTWTDLAHVTGAATQYTAPAGSFQGGTVYWRVRAYNIDNAAGPWSQAAAFVAVAAPPAPIVTAETVPFAVINWQSDGQQAYSVTVDDKRYGPYFGTQKNFALPDYLQDGEHMAKVEVQGSFGLWSQAGEVTFTVANTPGDAVQLSGVFSRDAQLSWNTASQTADFLVYRDGVRTGHTSGMTFADRTVLGQHSWQIINRLPGGYYTASNAVQGELESPGLAVAPLAGGEWLELTKSASSTREIGTTISQVASIRHFAGEIWPSAEIAPYRDKSVAFDVAWLQQEKTQAAAFEALIGQTVILKAPDGSCVVGLLSAVSRRSQIFFRAYTATVTRVKWRDYIDDALD